MFFEQLGVQFNKIAALAGEAYYVDAAGQSLQIDIRTHQGAYFVHGSERIFVAIKNFGLENSAAAVLKPLDAGVFASFHGGQEVFI